HVSRETARAAGVGASPPRASVRGGRTQRHGGASARGGAVLAVGFKVTVSSGEEAHRVAREWRAAGLPEYALWIHKADTADRRVRSGPADVVAPHVSVSGKLVIDRKSTRLNSSHVKKWFAVF